MKYLATDVKLYQDFEDYKRHFILFLKSLPVRFKHHTEKELLSMDITFCVETQETKYSNLVVLYKITVYIPEIETSGENSSNFALFRGTMLPALVREPYTELRNILRKYICCPAFEWKTIKL